MAEIKQIASLTKVRTEGFSIFIKSEFYDGELPNTISAFLAEIASSQDGTPYVQGDLVIQMLFHPELINYYIDGNGNLIVLSATGDANNYYIDGSGDLIWEGEI